MGIELRESVIGEAKSDHVAQFLDVVDYIYREDPSFVRPLDLDMKDRFSKKNPFFLHAEGVMITAHHNGKCVGRATAQVDREHLARHQDDAGFFGWLDTVDDPAVAKLLLGRCEAWLSGKGMRVMRGPFSFNINEESGCLVEGFDTPPMLYMAHHRAYQGGLIEAAGLEKVKDLYAWKYVVGHGIPKRAERAVEEIRQLPEVTSRTMDLGHMERDVRIAMDIFNDAWSENWGFVPLTEPELRKMAQDFKLLLVPDLTQIVSVDGEPVGMCVAVPNLNEAIADLNGKLFPVGLPKLLYRLKVKGTRSARLVLLGIRKKLRNVRKYAALSAYMYSHINEQGKKRGISDAELSWTLEDNGPVNAGIRLMGGQIYKRYRVYEKAIGS